MIEVKHISKEFEKKISKKEIVSFYADKDLSFTLKEGGILGILGPNGAGKTTLLRMLSGLMESSSGKIFVDGMEYSSHKKDIQRKIAFLSGSTKLYKDISPLELLQMCGEYYGVEKDVLEKRIQMIVKRFRMEEFLYQRIENLSTGQYQRVSIARCLVHDPKYYIFDEVTSGLDVISSQIILDFIKEEKKRGKGIIYSTHYMEEAENICDDVLFLYHGHILMLDKAKNILKKTKTSNLREAFFALMDGDK